MLDLSGVCIYTKDLGVTQAGNVSISQAKFAAGVYMVQLTSGNQKAVQRLIKD
ncbi:MAG: T9SS type A sorting domain-containing protein [Taibaiella sp.]|nr:T9SS type A sorting domain-containing protein [Taibaiella sp.]